MTTNSNLMENARIGKAAELLVRAQLLLRNEFPAVYDVDDGVDIVLKSGVRIHVKSALPYRYKHLRNNLWFISIRRGHNKRLTDFSENDILACVLFDSDKSISKATVFLIPTKEINSKGSVLALSKTSTRSKYRKYADNWLLVNQNREVNNV